MKLNPNEYILKCLAGLISFAGLFLSSFCYFLGWDFDLVGFAIYLVICLGEMLVVWVVYLILKKCNKNKVIIDEDEIKYVRGDEEVFSISVHQINSLGYIRFIKTFLMQFGSGYLHVYFEIDDTIDKAKLKNYLSFLPTGEAVLSISMPKKKAKEMAALLNLNLQVR